jgi:hypothetical protein
MIQFIYKSTRPSLDIKWYQKTKELHKLVEEARFHGKLISEEFKYEDSGLTLYTTSTWSTKDDYSDYVNSPEMLEWRIDRSLYNSKNNITFELYSKLEE